MVRQRHPSATDNPPWAEKEAKSFIKEQLNSKTSAEEKEMLEDAERDFDGLKKSLLEPLEEERKVMMADEK